MGVEEVRPLRAVLNSERKPAISTDLVLGATEGIHWRPIVLQATAVWAERLDGQTPWQDMLLVTGGMLVQALLAAAFLRNGRVN